MAFDSRAHLVSKYEVVYTSDPLARISDDRIQLFRTQHSVIAGRCQLFEMRGLAWCKGGQSLTALLYPQVQVARAYKFPWKLKRKPILLLAVRVVIVID